MASPLRLEPVEERHDTAPNSSSLFAAAYPQGLDKTEGSDSSPSSEFSSPAYSPERLADKKDADEGTTADMEEAQNLSKDEIKTKPSLREIKIFRVNSESDASSQGKDEIPEEIILEVNEAERVRSEEKQQLNIIATIKRKSMSDILRRDRDPHQGLFAAHRRNLPCREIHLLALRLHQFSSSRPHKEEQFSKHFPRSRTTHGKRLK